MRRSHPVLAWSLASLTLAGCASTGGPRGVGTASPGQPARKSGWLGGLAARRAGAASPPSGPASSAPRSESALAHYFPGLPRSNASGRAVPQDEAGPGATAPLLAASSRPIEPAIPADSPTLPVSLEVAVHPAPGQATAPAEVRIASREAPADPSPLIEAVDTPEPRPEPEPIVRVKAEDVGLLPDAAVAANVTASSPGPIVEAKVEEPMPLPEPAPIREIDSQALVPSALDEELPTADPSSPAKVEEPVTPPPLVAEPVAPVVPLTLPSGPIEPLADPEPSEPAPVPVAASASESDPLPELGTEAPVSGPPAEAKAAEPPAAEPPAAEPPPLVEAPAGPTPPAAPAIPLGRPRLARIAPVRAAAIPLADRANLLFPRTYYDPESFATAPPAPEIPPGPQAHPARRPSLLRRWFGRPSSPSSGSGRLEPGDVPQGR